MNDNRFPDGVISNDLVVFDGGCGTAFASCGLNIVAPVIENALPVLLDQLEIETRSMLRGLPPDMRMQVSWSMRSDFRSELLSYYERTQASGADGFVTRERNERFVRYSEAMEAGLLRFQEVRFFLSRKFSADGLDVSSLEAESRGFEPVIADIRSGFERLGGSARRMSGDELFGAMFRYCNPSRTSSPDYDPAHSLAWNCLSGDGCAVESGLHLDGRFFGFLAIKSPPQMTCSGIIAHLTALPVQDYGISVEVNPLDAMGEIAKEEREIQRLMRSMKGGGQARSLTVLEQRQQRVRKLVGNEETPFKMRVIVRVWDRSKSGLEKKLGILKSAVTRMQLATYYAPDLPTSARSCFLAGLPGWCWSQCPDFFHPVGDAPLANLLPLAGSPRLGDTEALYDGPNHGLMGISSFLGQSAAPQHALVLGKSGSGKSCFVMDLLTQTSPGYEFTVIVDNGLSYEGWVQEMDPGNEAIVFRPGCGVTLNYLDTRHAPLGPDHMSDAVAVIHLMAGHRQDEYIDKKRLAVISRSFHQFYRDFSSDWLAAVYGRKQRVRQYAALLLREKSPWADVNIDRRHRKFCEHVRGRENVAAELLGGVSEEEMRNVTAEILLDLALAFMPPEEAPRHSDFQAWLELEGMRESDDREEVADLALLMKAWCSEGGMHGSVVDGVNTVNLTGPIVHLELGQIPDSAPELRELAALIVTNQIKNEILRRPRDQRKRVVFEELGSFLSIHNGEKIVREFCQTARKYGTWVVGVAQQLEGMEAILAGLLGNIRLAVLMKQSSVQEVELLGRLFELPDSSKDALSRFPEPSARHGAPFLCWRSCGERPEILTGFHVASSDMLRISSSHGADFERRRKKQSIGVGE